MGQTSQAQRVGEASSPSMGVTSLPPEILSTILSFLALPDLARASLSCKAFFRSGWCSEFVWQQMCLQRELTNGDGRPWREVLKAAMLVRFLPISGADVSSDGKTVGWTSGALTIHLSIPVSRGVHRATFKFRTSYSDQGNPHDFSIGWNSRQDPPVNDYLGNNETSADWNSGGTLFGRAVPGSHSCVPYQLNDQVALEFDFNLRVVRFYKNGEKAQLEAPLPEGWDKCWVGVCGRPPLACTLLKFEEV
ncbi:hypothetical protein PAPYR_5608 [Paratrimastix pyriformis]|uniref:F-box domain-containing protein n=1 Tax=Paratrimastix pyriformis TaxID=342808 RepID=A0ABQ8UHC9_9EUKA|nr:hypothetical protein PAPYR_5608 [Paratrimastix pyriformis]